VGALQPEAEIIEYFMTTDLALEMWYPSVILVLNYMRQPGRRRSSSIFYAWGPAGVPAARS